MLTQKLAQISNFFELSSFPELPDMSHSMGKLTICISENKDADQLRGNREADQRLCFCYTDSAFPLLLKSKISSFLPASATVQPRLCRTWSEPKLLVFSRTGSYHDAGMCWVHSEKGNQKTYGLLLRVNQTGLYFES